MIHLIIYYLNAHHLSEHLLPNLVFASHPPISYSKAQLVSYFVWGKQVTLLTTNLDGGPTPIPMRRHDQNQSWMGSRWPNLYDNYSCGALTPHCLVCSSVVKGSSLQLLSLLVNDCGSGVRPVNADIYVNEMSQEIADLLYTAWVARENGFKITGDCTTCISIIHHLLSKVVTLKLQCQRYAEIGAMIKIIEAVAANQKQCQLQYLYCTLPDL